MACLYSVQGAEKGGSIGLTLRQGGPLCGFTLSDCENAQLHAVSVHFCFNWQNFVEQTTLSLGSALRHTPFGICFSAFQPICI